MVTLPPRTRPVPSHGERQRAAALVVDRDTEPAQRVEHLAHRPGAGVRVAVEDDRAVRERGHRRHEPHDGPGQAAVDRGRSGEPARA